MAQKLSRLISSNGSAEGFPWVKFSPMKTKLQIRSEASKKAARTRRRQKLMRMEAGRP